MASELGATVWINKVEEKKAVAVRVVSGGQIREITITLGVPWHLDTEFGPALPTFEG